jgi:hypothetical protein
MKFNWKVLVASVLIVAAIYWAVGSILPGSYSGSNLDFAVGTGPVTITNPTNESIPVQLVGSRSRSFSVTSALEGLSGSAARQGTGTSSTYVYEFELPTGKTEFTISRGTDVHFIANTPIKLEATVQPVSENAARTTLMVGAVVALLALYYISRTTGHRWIGILRGKAAPVQETQPTVVSTASGQGPAIRAYGDNRSDTGD